VRLVIPSLRKWLPDWSVCYLRGQVHYTASCRSSLAWPLKPLSSYSGSSLAQLGCASLVYLSGTDTVLSPEVDRVRTPLATLEVFLVGLGITSSG